MRRSCSLQGMAEAELQELVDGGEAGDGSGGAAMEPTETKVNQGVARSCLIPQLRARQVAKSFSRHSSECVTPPKRIPVCA
jgi:hypothetical protein